MARGDAVFSAELGKRLKEIKDLLNIDASELANRLGVSKATVSNYIKGRRLPDAGFVRSLCKEFNVNPEWFLFGTGDPIKPVGAEDESFSDYEFIPSLSSISFLEEPKCKVDLSLAEDWYPFKKKWLQKILGSDNFENKVRHLFLYRVADEGMTPTLNPQELVLVDGNLDKRINPSQGRIYLVQIATRIFVFRKIVLIRIEGREAILVCIGDKPDYPPAELRVSEDKLPERIIGEALWVGREIRK